MQTLAEIELEIDRLRQLAVEVSAKEAEIQKQEGLKEAHELTGKLTEILHRLDELGYVPPALFRALSREGKFNPGMFIKRPRLPTHDEDIDADTTPPPVPKVRKPRSRGQSSEPDTPA